jgi:hypothetical protein
VTSNPAKLQILTAFASMIALLSCAPAAAAGSGQFPAYLTQDCKKSTNPPKCTRLMTIVLANDIRSFVEWALGFKLDAATAQSIEDGTAVDMSSDPAGVQATVRDMYSIATWATKHSASESAMLRSLIEPQLVAGWQADTGNGSATSRALVAAWRSHNQIIAEGRPPLRRAVVDAYVTMFEFTAKQAGKPIPGQIANHDQFAKRMAAEYAAAPAAAQMQFNQVQPLWLSLQSLWAQATPAQQNAFRAVWRGKPVAVKPPPTAAPQAGFGGNIGAAQEYQQKSFVDGQLRTMMATPDPFVNYCHKNAVGDTIC